MVSSSGIAYCMIDRGSNVEKFVVSVVVHVEQVLVDVGLRPALARRSTRTPSACPRGSCRWRRGSGARGSCRGRARTRGARRAGTPWSRCRVRASRSSSSPGCAGRSGRRCRPSTRRSPCSAKLMRISAVPDVTNCSVRLTTSCHSWAMARTRSCTVALPSRKRTRSVRPFCQSLKRSTAARGRPPAAARSGRTLVLSTRSAAATSSPVRRGVAPIVPPSGWR